MADHVQRRDIGRYDEKTLFALSQCLDDFLDAAFELTSLGGFFDQTEEAAGELGGSEGRGDG